MLMRIVGIGVVALALVVGQVGSVFAEASSEVVIADNFDDGVLSANWQSVPVHKEHLHLQNHSTPPDIQAQVVDGRLQILGSEKGDDTPAWHGRGLKYAKPVSGSIIAQFDYDSLEAFSEITQTVRCALGIRLQKDANTWIEVRQTDDVAGDRLEYTAYNEGERKAYAAMQSNPAGQLSIKFDNASGMAEYFINGVKKGEIDAWGLQDSEFYVLITAYSSNASNNIRAYVDNFQVLSVK